MVRGGLGWLFVVMVCGDSFGVGGDDDVAERLHCIGYLIKNC